MTWRIALSLSLLALTLAGCGSADDDELQAWMNEQRAQTKPRVAPIPEPKKFVPQGYMQEGATDPFSLLKLTLALKGEATQPSANAALVAPELNRRKESLESYPLDTMAMVGSMVKAGVPIALVKVDSLLYQVRVGNYLGQNYGRITKINETQVGIREIVQDAAGEWVERAATLQLQERSK